MIQLVAEASRIYIPQRPRPLEARDFVVIVARKLAAMSPRFAKIERILNAVWSMCTQINCSLNGMEDREVHLRCFFRSNRDGRFVLILLEIGNKGAHLGLILLRFLKFVFDRTQARFA